MSDFKSTTHAFRPVRCLEESIETLAPIEGYVLFTTDTKKIYACIDGEYKMMGGSSGVYYGDRVLTDDEKYGDEVFFTFYASQIDGKNLPGVDDLILNIPDGGFYRVLEVDGEEISTQRLAISGGGGGGNGSSSDENAGTLDILYVTPQRSSTIAGQDFYIEYEIVAKDSAGDPIIDAGVATWKINGKEIVETVYNGDNKFKVDQYLDPTLDVNNISLVVSMNTGGYENSIKAKTWKITAVALSLNWDWAYDENSYISGDTFTLNYTPNGGVDCTNTISFHDKFGVKVKEYVQSITAKQTGSKVYTDAIESLEYGTYTCEMFLTAVVNGIDYKTPTVKNELSFTKNGSATILTVPFYATVATQYDTLKIPFMVYDPDLDTCAVSFYVNDVRVGGDTYARGLQYWPYTLNEYGSVKLSIRSDNGDASKDLELIVNEINLDASEVMGSAFTLKANAFSSNNELRNWSHNGVTLTFSDGINDEYQPFDWENGGLQFDEKPDGSIEKYICVRQGTRMTVNYALFNSNDTSREGKDFKVCFKAANCYDYSAPVLSCYEDSTNGSGVGVRLEAQQAIFSSATYPDFATQYFENSYIELETEIWPDVPDPDPDNNLYGDRFMMFWVDGIPAGVKAFPRNENFKHLRPQYITVGSDLCDVYIYVMKVYERKLTEDEHLDNFIMDAPSTEMMLDRYNRNDILDNTGEISYTKLVEKNPDCHVYMYDVSRMPTGKTADGEDDIVSGCTYTELYQSNNSLDNPFYSAENTDIYVQGTSSAAYGAAAFNLRTEFPEGLKDKDGNEVEGWQVTPDAEPIDLTCTKVNVASCENCNNVVNAEWYNKYQPYHDAHRRKGPQYRDTMQFESGVLFIKDNNPEKTYTGTGEVKDKTTSYLKANCFLDTVISGVNYTEKPYYKMYAIGNMGNDKKNRGIFHDRKNIKACCVEVLDNQNAKHWMTDPNLSISDFVLSDEQEGFYEFRFAADKSKAAIPEGFKDGKEYRNTVQAPAFLDFVRWMASCDPSPKSAEHPSGYKASQILQPEVADVNATTYKKNVYFIEENDKYIKAMNDFDSTQTYYNIIAVEPQGDEETIEVVFGDYTFKGFDPPGYEGTENPSKISLKDFTVTEFAGTYTHDTKNYRIAKMLSECEDHLVMDSVMFHYLFIQRHTMVDNVAKNTFWSTEDLIHWDLTKNYDNDTSDGNNNSGYLTFTYGIENLDKTDAGADIFNASGSVWINFCHALQSAQKKLHQALATKGAWEATPYLNECSRHQDKIPERCWIQNYFHHYIRPRRLGLDENTFLNRLEGGKKTHQRRQYENYQEFYLDSKYLAGTQFTDSASVDMRLNKRPNANYIQCTVDSEFSAMEAYYIKNNAGEYELVEDLTKVTFDSNKTNYWVQEGTWDTNNKLTVSFYTDCYPSIHIGGQVHRSPNRVKRGDTYDLPVGTMIQSANDSTCYLYGSSMLQTLTGLADTYPSYVKLANAGKLRSIAYGSDAETYYNPNLTSLDIGSNAMLQYAQAQNSGQAKGIGATDLTKAAQLKELLVDGSTLKALTLPDGGIVERIKLNDLTTLSMSNLTMLEKENITLDEGIFTKMNNLTVKNCPGMDDYSYRMALEAPMTNYALTEFNWTIGEDVDFVVGDDGTVLGFTVVDKLITKLPNGGTHAAALVGTIHVDDVPGATNEYNIYKRYCKIYPNLIITYDDSIDDDVLNRAVEIVFMGNDTEDAAVHYRVLGTGEIDGDSVGKLISTEGPTGVAIHTPGKEPIADTYYTFTGYWTTENNPDNINDDTMHYYVEGFEFAENAVAPKNVKSFNEVIPTENMIFYPKFDDNVRTYEVKFHDYDGNVVEDYDVPYGLTYKAAGGTLTNFYYLDSGNLLDNQRYGFKGWTTVKYEANKGKNVEYVDIFTYVIRGPLNLYPYYEIEDVESVASNLEYFEVNGSVISLKEDYKDTIQGKITLPNIVGVNTVGTMWGATKITHIYFLRGSSAYKSIGNEAFMNCSGLTTVSLPMSIEAIGDKAFQQCFALTTISLPGTLKSIGSYAFAGSTNQTMRVAIQELPDGLMTLGQSAFWNAGSNVIITKLPKNLEVLNGQTFTFCPGVQIANFGSDGSGSLLKSIGTQCFYGAGAQNGGGGVSKIYFGTTVTEVGSNSFYNYCAPALKNAYFTNSRDTYIQDEAGMGFTASNVSVAFDYDENVGG